MNRCAEHKVNMTDKIPRQPQGTPTGGKFAATTHSDEVPALATKPAERFAGFAPNAYQQSGWDGMMGHPGVVVDWHARELRATTISPREFTDPTRPERAGCAGALARSGAGPVLWLGQVGVLGVGDGMAEEREEPYGRQIASAGQRRPCCPGSVAYGLQVLQRELPRTAELVRVFRCLVLPLITLVDVVRPPMTERGVTASAVVKPPM